MHLSEIQKKYRDTCDENDRRMAEMTRLHNDEVENLRRQLSAANRDLDMLRGKLVSLEVKEAERIAEHTVYTGIDPTEAKKLSLKKQKKSITIGIVVVSARDSMWQFLILLSTHHSQYFLFSSLSHGFISALPSQWILSVVLLYQEPP